VRTFDGRTQQQLGSFSPYGAHFSGGLFAGGDARAAVLVPVDPVPVVTIAATVPGTTVSPFPK
jgi:hypothetical protein